MTNISDKFCKITLSGSEYRGTINTTASGESCLAWSRYPDFADASNFPEGNLEDAKNYCRSAYGEELVCLVPPGTSSEYNNLHVLNNWPISYKHFLKSSLYKSNCTLLKGIL